MSSLLKLFEPPEETQEATENDQNPTSSLDLSVVTEVEGQPSQVSLELSEAISEPQEQSHAKKEGKETFFQSVNNSEFNDVYKLQQTAIGSYRLDLVEELDEIRRRDLEALRNRTVFTEEDDEELYAWRRWFENLHGSYKRSKSNYLFLLFIVGLLTGVASYAMETSIYYLYRAHVELTMLARYWPLQFLVWIVFLLILFHLAYFMVRYISPCAMGSGIPEMESILNGVLLVNYLSLRTFFVKSIGLVAVIGGGIAVGREGPFVHIASIIAYNLLRVPMFKEFRKSEELRSQILTSAIAAGMASNFGAPIGGLLFSIEVTSTYYPVRHYFFSAWAATASGFTFRVLWNLTFDNPVFGAIEETYYPVLIEGYAPAVLLIFLSILIGLIGSAIGVCFIGVTVIVIEARKRLMRSLVLFRNPYLFSLSIVLLTAVLCFPELVGDYMALPLRRAFSDLITQDSMQHSENARDWLNVSVYSSVLLYGLSRFWFTPFSITMPVPCGLFFPCLVLGAAFGRFFGEALKDIFPLPWEDENQFPGMMAIIGSAAVATSVTQTLSVAVIMVELTGQMVLFIPITVTVVISLFLTKRYSYSIYDGLMKSKGLPFLPDLPVRGHGVRAVDIMDRSVIEKNFYVLPEERYRNLVKLLHDAPPKMAEFPIVSSDGELRLFGRISRESIEELLAEYRTEILSYLEEGNSQSESYSDDNQRTVGTFQDRMKHLVDPGSSIHEDDFSRPIHGLTSWMDDFLQIPIDHIHVQIEPSTPLRTLHIMAITMRHYCLFVTQKGCLVGTVTREDIQQKIVRSPFFEIIL